MKIYVDTNWFLSFYQSNHERQHMLDELAEHAELVVLTDQNATEFRRNRAALLEGLRKNVTKSTSVIPYTTSLLLGLPEHAAVLEASKQLTNASRALVERLDRLECADFEDKVTATFHEVLSKCTRIPVIEEDISLAQRRKARGIPPSTSKRDTIGDELIWECLLRGCEEDLAVVSLDADFLKYGAILASEFGAHANHRRLIYVGDKVSEALARCREASSEEYKERRHIERIRHCPSCGSDSWHYAGRDRNLVQTEKMRGLAGYPQLDPTAIAAWKGQEQHVYVCGQCNAIMLLT